MKVVRRPREEFEHRLIVFGASCPDTVALEKEKLQEVQQTFHPLTPVFLVLFSI